MTDILQVLEEKARTKAKAMGIGPDSEIFMLRGVFQTNYVLRLTEEESVFHLHYVLAQTVGQGCSYYDLADEQPSISEALLGSNVLLSPPTSRAIRIAALDAVYSSLNGTPTMTYTLNGSNIKKAHERSEIVCREVLSLLRNRPPKHGKKKTVVDVGVVGSFLKILTEHKDLEVKASDLYSLVVHNTVHGVFVENGTKDGSTHKGDRTLELVAEADAAIITGMTLANNTLGEIIATARDNQTALVMFAETGANFASQYCEMGVDVVVSEPFPFYLTGSGPTEIKIYRKH